MPTNPGKQAVVRFIEETTPGTTPADPDLLLFSPETQRVAFGLDKNSKESLDIGEVDVHDFFTVQNAYTLEVEFNLYDVTSGLADFLARRSDGAPKAFTIEVIPDEDAASPHYIRCTGWRVNDVALGGSLDNPYVVTITFAAGLIVDPTTSDPGIGTGSRETKTAYATRTSNAVLKHFSSGAITLDGSPVAVLLGSLELTVANGVEASYTTGSAEPVTTATRFGNRRYTGTADLSLDDGSLAHWTRVDGFTEHSLAIPFGTGSGDDILTLTGVRFPSIEVEAAVDTDILMGGQPFVAKTHAFSTVP